MSVEVVLETPLAAALHAAIQPKLVEVGWSTGTDDDSALSEYIILMLANGKTQEQVAAELSGDLLNLGDDDPGAKEFSQWLFSQVAAMRHQIETGEPPQEPTSAPAQNGDNDGQDAEMGDVADVGDKNVPTGPKSMRNGTGMNSRPRDKRMLNHLVKTMDRSHDAVLHRVRPQSGTERINTHARAPPTGPRQAPAMGRGLGARIQPPNGRPHGGMPGIGGQGGAGGNPLMNLSPQQLYAMLEQQSQLVAQMMSVVPPMGNGFQNNNYNQFQPPNRPLASRIQANPQRPNNTFRRPQPQNNGHSNKPPNVESSMDIDTPHTKTESLSPDTICKYNIACTNKDCKFAHQSPAAPPGTTIDVSDSCAFGAACKNRKCTGRHPSPAQRIAHQTEQDCKFFPNCTNARCPFRHPTTPMCHNGPDCKVTNCKFTHIQTKCKFNPCLNPVCGFKHEEGQKRGKFADKTWVAPGLEEKEHVSERKFVDEMEQEELILPGGDGLERGLSKESVVSANIIT